MALEHRIKEARKNANLTQLQAASLIGVAKSTWAGYESGNSTPDIDKLVKIMDVLGVDANYLWQDYNNEETKKAPAPEGAEGKKFTVEDMKKLLVGIGFGDKVDNLSEKDVAFLGGIFDLLDAWFG